MKPKPGKKLPWLNQLNNMCDDLATQYLDTTVAPISKVSHLPASSISLTINNVSITGHCARELRIHASLPALRAHLESHMQWAPQVFDSIAWDLYHSRTISLAFEKRIFSVKLIHNLLPFQERQHRWNLSPDPACPSACGCDEETCEHFFLCPHPEQRLLWMEYFNALETTFKKHRIDPSLRKAWSFLLSPLAFDTYDLPSDLPDYASMLITTQQDIHPFSLPFGFASPQWVESQHSFLVWNNHPHRKQQASIGIKALLTLTIQHTHEAWLLRNTHLHVTNSSTNSCFRRSHLLTKIEALYESLPRMCTADRDILSFPFEARQSHSTRRLQSFYNWASPLVKKSLEDAASIGSNTLPLTHYFPPVRPQIPPELFSVIHLGAS